MTVQHASVINSLSNDDSDKLEERKMFWVHPGSSVRMEGGLVRGNRGEKCVVWIKHLSRKNLVPLSSQTTSINTLFATELNVELRFSDILRRFEEQRSVGVQKHLVPLHIYRQCWPITIIMMEFLFEVDPFVIKLQHLRVSDQNREWTTHQLRVVPNHLVQYLLVFLSE
ncbi:hypothetical protein OGATHE_000160 [Ogataea polymorpha]|uniref:Uncharacterized protein n=1 Tax=Ogataea polymorpha TaxID=460523 RepID=A0A9P8PVY2_9ASCO|nr:hypothetical protein OGATHE_000160 [Ogataea polymorpha]